MSLKVKPLANTEREFRDNRHPLLPKGPTFRASVIGKTGCGKSLLCAWMIASGALPTNKAYLCLHLPDQDVYRQLNEKMEEALEMLNEQIRQRNEELSDSDSEEEAELELSDLIETITEPSELPKVEEMAQQNYLVLFDDFITETRQLPLIQKYFTGGRHKGISCLFLSQSFFDIPKLIRRNCEYFFVFGGMDDDQVSQLKRRIGGGLSKERFQEIYKKATTPTPEDPHPFLMIDFKTNDPKLRFRRGFEEPLGE